MCVCVITVGGLSTTFRSEALNITACKLTVRCGVSPSVDHFPTGKPWVFQHIFAALPQVSNVNCQDFPWLCHVLCTANADDRWTGVVRTSFYDTHPTPSCQCCYNEASRVPRPEVSLGAGIGWKIRTVEQCHIFYFGILPWLPMFKTKSILWNWLLKISMDRVVSSAGEENFLEGKKHSPRPMNQQNCWNHPYFVKAQDHDPDGLKSLPRHHYMCSSFTCIAAQQPWVRRRWLGWTKLKYTQRPFLDRLGGFFQWQPQMSTADFFAGAMTWFQASVLQTHATVSAII